MRRGEACLWTERTRQFLAEGPELLSERGWLEARIEHGDWLPSDARRLIELGVLPGRPLCSDDNEDDEGNGGAYTLTADTDACTNDGDSKQE